MKLRKLDKWTSIDQSKNLLFFAQLLDELFFDFSLDTYKPSAMNSSLLCEEALEVIQEVDNGNIKEPNIKHVLNELCTNLDSDEVSKSLITLDLQQIKSVLLPPKGEIFEKKVVIELISKEINLKKYREKNEQLLIDAIINHGDFRRIRSLTRSYATTLVNLGFSSEFISNTTQNFFFYSTKNQISENKNIEDFLAIFSAKPDTYSLIFKSPENIINYKASFNAFDIELKKDLSDLSVNTSNFNLENQQIFVCLKGIKARDTFAAKNAAENILETLSTIFGLFHHKQQIKWQPECLILNQRTLAVKKSKININAMHKCIDQRPPVAARSANKFLSEFGLESSSFNIFSRSAQLHSLALNSDSKENQLLNLWIALESIIPAKHSDLNSNIEHIINKTTPFLNLGYFQRLVIQFTSDLFNWNKGRVLKTLKDIPGKNSVIKVAKLLALSEYEPQRAQLKSHFKDFHLMSDRFDYLCFIHSSPENMLSGLKSHSERVGWQIRRIYRARNLIVHSGNTPSYTEILIENIHGYLDKVMNNIIQLASKSRKATSIEQAFKYVELTYAELEKILSTKEFSFNDEFIERMYAEL